MGSVLTKTPMVGMSGDAVDSYFDASSVCPQTLRGGMNITTIASSANRFQINYNDNFLCATVAYGVANGCRHCPPHIATLYLGGFLLLKLEMRASFCFSFFLAIQKVSNALVTVAAGWANGAIIITSS